MHALLSADALTVTTPELKQALIPFNPNVVVLPNYLDKDLWQFRQPALRSMDAQVRILFMGTPRTPPTWRKSPGRCAIQPGATAAGCALFFWRPPARGLADLAQVDYQPVKASITANSSRNSVGLRQISRLLR